MVLLDNFLWKILLIYMLPIAAMKVEFKQVCRGSNAVLSCPIPHSEWKLKKKGNTSQTILTQRTGDELRVTRAFKDRIRILKNNTLVITSFQSEYDGMYICMYTNSRQTYQLVAVPCQIEACIGDKVVIECGLYGHVNFKELEWKDNRTTIIRANHRLDTECTNDKFKGIYLSRNISGALVVPSVQYGVQRFTCVLHGDAGTTPRRSTVILTPNKCRDKITAVENTKVDLICPYYYMLGTHPSVSKLVWTKGSIKIVTIHVHGRHVTHDDTVVRVEGKVSIISVTARDIGTFTCSVITCDGVELAKHNVTLDVTPAKKNNKETMDTASGGRSWKPSSILFGLLLVCLCVNPNIALYGHG